MKKFSSLTILLLLSLSSQIVFSQEKDEVKEQILAEGNVKNVFDKKFRWGISWNQHRHIV